MISERVLSQMLRCPHGTVSSKLHRSLQKLKKQMEQVDNVDSVIWYDSIMDIAIPDEILPKDIREAYRNDDLKKVIHKFTN